MESAVFCVASPLTCTCSLTPTVKLNGITRTAGNVRNLHSTWELRPGPEKPFWRLYSSWHDSSLMGSKYNRILSFSRKHVSGSGTDLQMTPPEMFTQMYGGIIASKSANKHFRVLCIDWEAIIWYSPPKKVSLAREAGTPSASGLSECPGWLWTRGCGISLARWVPATLMITPAADGKQRLVPPAPPKEGTSQNSCCVTLMSAAQLCACWHCWGQSFWKLLLNQPLLPLGPRFAS